MASRCPNPHVLPINVHATTRAKSSMSGVQAKQVPAVKIHPLKFKTAVKNKIYEDHERGIVCYRDDDGEVICEGLDEGPRYQPPAITRFNGQRGIQKYRRFRRNQVQLIEAVDFFSPRMFGEFDFIWMSLRL